MILQTANLASNGLGVQGQRLICEIATGQGEVGFN